MSGNPHRREMSAGIQPPFSRVMSSPSQARAMSSVFAANISWDVEDDMRTVGVDRVIGQLPETDMGLASEWRVNRP